jgi:hypothetical protein
MPNVDHLFSKIMGTDGKFKIRPASFYDQFDPLELRIFCHFLNIFHIPTTESIEWLKNFIETRKPLRSVQATVW